MVTVDEAAPDGLLRRPVTSGGEEMRRLAHLLTRSLAAEGISDDLVDTLEEVFALRPVAVEPGPKLDRLVARLLSPVLRQQRRSKPAPPSTDDVARIADRFRRATRQLVQVVPYRVDMYPTDKMRRLLALGDEHPTDDEALSYLRRYALAIVAVLDVMGDDE
ncbi:hypothetical protein ACFW6E_34650 [Streptomyces olivaceoviridis]|uniref:hypothetical protein n=1 Tax=Streptomyces TaxID=1883 RepID=UPI0007187DC6|nr:hypothetical protein SHL15_4069 [Streptomyces hygroscopicus subsp. limoneus]